ncbi:TPR domain protein [Nostoc sp. NIES-3756]|uniref:CHAT domain-containing tetratricopeptide repeat protein n=1 Tax=Nostoc sp. NIES-3756 TaxID=1751286 RepID=UPI0007204F07|nr:CHAT domain-containing protein [Nostoc sp. NIES-3756]BAT53056.1 TPR domain protein [Nostoc sp. NIES-3756]
MDIYSKLQPKFLLLLFCLIWCFYSSSIKADAEDIRLVQLPVSIDAQVDTQRQEAYLQAKKFLQAADKLLYQGTKTSRQQALINYEKALKIWEELELRPEKATTLLSIGTIYHIENNHQKALEYYLQALAIRRELKNRFEEAVVLGSIANVYFNLDDNLKALEYYNQALSLFRLEQKNEAVSDILMSIGRLYLKVGETQKALDFYNQALSLQRNQNNLNAQSNILQTIGQTYVQLGENQKALKVLNQALEIERKIKNVAGQIDILNLLGTLYISVGETQKAREFFDLVLSLQKTTPGISISSQVLTLMGISGAYSTTGEYDKSLGYLQQAQSLLQQSGNTYAEAEALEQISFIYDRIGQKQKALDSLNKALIIQRKNKYFAREAFTLSNIAAIHESTGDYQKSLDFYNQALALQRQIKERTGEANTLTYIAKVYNLLGEYQSSVQTYNQALDIFQTIQDRSKVAQTLDNIASAYRAAENYQTALDFYNRALQLWREQGAQFQEFSTLTGIIRVYESLKDYPKALDVASQALFLSKKQQNSFLEASALAFLGRVHLSKGDFAQALDLLTQSSQNFEKLSIKNAEANVLSNIGKAYNSLKQHQQAIKNYNRELDLRQQLGDLAGKAETLYNMAIAERDQGNLSASVSNIEKTIKIVEDIRTNLTSQELRTSYFASVQKYYEFYINLLMRLHKQQPSQGYDAKALEVSEQARARSLMDLLKEANVDIRQGVDSKLLEQERALQQEISASEKLRIQLLTNKQNEAQAQALEKKIEELLEQYRQIQAKIRTLSPGYAALTQVEPVRIAQIQSSILDENTLLLEYFLGEERSYVWAVTKKSITAYELPKRADIEAVAQDFLQNLTNPIQRVRTAKAASTLSQIILAPVAKQLKHQRLAIVSDGILQYVPFSALSLPTSPNNNMNPQPLATRHEVVNLPSASTIKILRQQLTRRKTPTKMLAVIADPIFSQDDQRIGHTHQQLSNSNKLISQQQLTRSAGELNINFERLTFTRQEAEQILSLVSPKLRKQAFDFAANRNTAMDNELSQYRILHFATHGILNSIHPELSGLVLSLFDKTGSPQNGFLRLHDIFNLKLSSQLVVLSACQTGLGKQVKGEGLIGLTRGFMYAGSPTLVVSLWNVDDEATAIFMQSFYKKMLQDGLKPTTALRAAQMEMWQSQNYSEPYYWAAFTLQGEWQ